MNLDYILKANNDAMYEENQKSYFYAATRARAMISKLLTEQDYEKLIRSNIINTCLCSQ